MHVVNDVFRIGGRLPFLEWGLVLLLVGLGACAPDASETTGTASDIQTDTSASLHPTSIAEGRERLIAPRFETFTVSDGLVSGEANVFLQDRRGFLWVGTFGGLSRFDGATFTNFLHDPADSTSLAQNKVNDLIEDRDGYIWVATNGGLDRLNPQTERFTHYSHDPADPTSLGDDAVRAVVQGAKGAIWAGTWGNGLNRLDVARGTWTRIPRTFVDPQFDEDEVHALLANEDGTLWVGGSDGLVLYNPVDGTFTPVRQKPGALNGPVLPIVYSLLRDRSGSIWAGTRTDGLYRYDPATQAVVRYPSMPSNPRAIGNPWVLAMTEDRAGTVWIGTNGAGLHRYDRESDAFTRFSYEPSNPASLRDNSVLSVFESQDGVLWVGTYGGVARRYPLSHFVDHIRPGGKHGLSSNAVKAFAEDASGTLWVGTEGGGLHRRVVSGSDRFTQVAYDTDDPSSRAATEILSLAIDDAGTLWVGAIGGLYRRAPGAEAFTRTFEVPRNARDRMRQFIYDLDVTDGRVLAAAGMGGVADISVREGRALRIPIQTPPETVTAVLHDRRGQVWAGTYNSGLWRRVGSEEASPRFEKVSLALNSQQINTLYEDRTGALWIGTGDGLDRLTIDGADTTLTHFHRADGLPDTVIRGIAEDGQNRLWIATTTGLSWRNAQTGAFLSYDARDGIETGGPMYRSPYTGRIYVGGNEGYMVFHPEHLTVEPPPPAPVLTSLQVSGRPIRIGGGESPLRHALQATPSVRLRYDDRVVTFTFASLDYQAPSKHRYAVRLDGFDEDWREVGRQRQATFTNLGPGAYTFRVRAAGRGGRWGEANELRVTITPPWWQTGWAYLAYTLLVVGIGATAYWDRRRRLHLRRQVEIKRIEADKLRELDHARSRFFANVSHEFRTPLTLTLGPLSDLMAGLYGPLDAPTTQQVDLAHRNAQRVLDLINQMLDVARLEAGRTLLRARPLDLGAFVEELAQPFQDLARRKAITLNVEAPEAPIEIYADPVQLEKAVANLLANAVKFTPEGGTVRATVAVRDATAQVAVRDSGPGIPAEDLPRIFDRFYQVGESGQTQLGTGIGLALANEILALHSGTLSVESEEGFGSTFTLALPLGRSHLTPDQIDGRGELWTPASVTAAPPNGNGEAAVNGRSTGNGTAGDEAATDETPPDETPPDVTTILVVEDHAEIRAYIRRHLESGPDGAPTYRVIEAADGEAGLALARKHLPDLVLSDVMMPHRDGLQLCRALKADAETAFIPIILLTAKAAPEDKLEGLQEHADDYLTKPFDVHELRARIDNLITSRKQLRDRLREATPAIHASDVDAVSSDAAFCDRVRRVIEAHLGDEDFTVERLAEEMGLSRVHLYRRLRELIDQSPSTLIRTMRLERAAQLLAQESASVGEIAYGVGFKSVSHFSRSFREHYGTTPTAYSAQSANPS